MSQIPKSHCEILHITAFTVGRFKPKHIIITVSHAASRTASPAADVVPAQWEQFALSR